ncbi:MAG: glycosyltransferase family 4 protein [Thermoleophilia bacterium]|nr:glycosyltransferase family 4 protein [Thermoleophilia bacterium]
MRVLYVSQYFVNADQPGGVRHWMHTQALLRAGHAVGVVTSYVQHKERTIPERYRGRKIVREVEDGLQIWRTYSTPGYGRDLRSRLANYTSFATWASVAMMRIPRPDVIVASSPSLPAATAAAAVARVRRVPFVMEARDLWSDSAKAMGLITNPRVLDAARRMERFCYGTARHVIALTEGIRDGVIAEGVPPEKVSLITNGIDRDVIGDAEPEPVDAPVPPGAFVAMYVGAHGTYSSLETVLGAAELLRDREDIRVVLVGGGDRKPALREDASRRGLTNVAFVDPVPKRDVPRWLARAQVALLPYQALEFFGGALPNKAFDYLAAGRPILAAAPEGELTRLIREIDCGVCVAPEDPAAMADAIRALADDRALGEAMGSRGRAAALERFDRRALAARFVAIVEAAARG